MKKVTVYITLKQGVLDPEGKAIGESLNALGYQEIVDARVGKFIELQVDEGPNLEERMNEMCDRLLANPIIEDYRFQVEEAVQS
ncbi:phosphoribosylformylglycinamidine synthase subunit PurS [Oceanobacillus bengalensis]|uniref:Phosphoribosylformylglycinamidine synthase subunit PurS n=1 Tax=Oceanobacillus bengalensis TaxID=1435466 RepID=A0A494YUL3_9BACI|nr:phosphoribosylformylglycinamidine synthase subunit PurS [Oceanobacillus bengalensis]RKQ13818.1 phosphoribosylformylglycinamidine synthase subunit PurS [Oceanobacillus bengalensis]